MEKITDAFEAAASFQKGQEAGFTYFFNKHYHALVYYAWKIMGDKPSAEDAVENSFVKIWDRFSTFSHPMVIKAWLYTTVRNDCLNKLQAFSNAPAKIEKYLSGLPEEEAPIDENIIRAEVYAEVRRCIELLPTKCREIMRLLFVEGLSVAQVSKQLSISKSTVKNTKGIGLEKVKVIFGKGFEVKIPAPGKNNHIATNIPQIDRNTVSSIKWRNVFKLWESGKSFKEISSLTGIPLRTVYHYYNNYSSLLK